MSQVRIVQSPKEIAVLITKLAGAIAEAIAPEERVGLVGIRRGGVALAGRLAALLREKGRQVELGTVDIALYRDDTHLTWPRPSVGSTDIPFPVDGRHVVVVDDVFWTGRTARAAIDAVLDFGRPRRLWLATLAQRPGRELPISPDFCPFSTQAAADEQVKLRLVEDGHPHDELVLFRREAALK